VLYHTGYKAFWKGEPPYARPGYIDYDEKLEKAWTKDLSHAYTAGSKGAIKAQLTRQFNSWGGAEHEEIWHDMESAGDIKIIKLISTPHEVIESAKPNFDL